MSSSIQICKLLQVKSRFAEKCRCRYRIWFYALLLNSRLSEFLWTNFTYENSPNNGSKYTFLLRKWSGKFNLAKFSHFNGPFSRKMIMRFRSYQHRKSKVIFLFSDCCNPSLSLLVFAALLLSFRIVGYVTLGSELLKRTDLWEWVRLHIVWSIHDWAVSKQVPSCEVSPSVVTELNDLLQNHHCHGITEGKKLWAVHLSINNPSKSPITLINIMSQAHRHYFLFLQEMFGYIRTRSVFLSLVVRVRDCAVVVCWAS